MFLVNELWKDIDGFEGKYKVSTRGRVIDTKTGFEKLQYVKQGYAVVSLNKKNYKTHRLVASAFIPNPNNYDEVNHIDEDKLNNDVNNLEWCTHKQNVNWGTRNERAAISNGTPIVCLDFDGNLVKEYPSISSVEADGFHYSSVSACIKGRSKTAQKFIWMRKSEYEALKNKQAVKNIAALRTSKKKRKTTHIYQISIDGLVMREWDSVAFASKCGAGAPNTIAKVVNHDKGCKTASGFIWLKVEEYKSMSVEDFISLVNNARRKSDKLGGKQIELIKRDKEKYSV